VDALRETRQNPKLVALGAAAVEQDSLKMPGKAVAGSAVRAASRSRDRSRGKSPEHGNANQPVLDRSPSKRDGVPPPMPRGSPPTREARRRDLGDGNAPPFSKSPQVGEELDTSAQSRNNVGGETKKGGRRRRQIDCPSSQTAVDDAEQSLRRWSSSGNLVPVGIDDRSRWAPPNNQPDALPGEALRSSAKNGVNAGLSLSRNSSGRISNDGREAQWEQQRREHLAGTADAKLTKHMDEKSNGLCAAGAFAQLNQSSGWQTK